MSAKYLILDAEMTGLNPHKNGLIQFATAALDKNLKILETFVTDICPPEGFEINEEALQINGFSLERIQKGISYEIFCHSLFDFIKRNFGQNKPVAIAQFYPADYGFLQMTFSKVGLEKEFNEVFDNDFVDTKSLVNTLNLISEIKNHPIPFEITSLSKPGGLKEKLDLKSFPAHDALGDILATREVLLKLIEIIG
jgi:DNA polymerase III epsilon subunit-like protein